MQRNYIRLIILLLFCCLSLSVKAQYYATKLYGESEGALGSIYNLIQHSDGSLWYGTYSNGIFRFDGQSFKHYSTQNGMANDFTKNLFEDQFGNVWANSNDHGTSYVTPQGKVVKVEETSTNKEVKITFYDKKSKSVLGVYEKKSNAFFKYDFDKKQFVNHDSFYVDENRYKMEQKSWWCVYGYNLKLLWLRDLKTNRIGYYELNKENNSLKPFFTPTSNEEIMNFYDDKNIAFISTKKDIYIKKAENWQKNDFNDFGIKGENIITSLHYSNHSFNCIQENENGSYTLISFSEDFKTCQKYPFKYSGSKHFLGTGILKDKANSFWITSSEGLIKLMPSIFIIDNKAPNMLKDLYQVQEDKFGKVWLGSYRDGTAYFDGEKVEKMPPLLAKLEATYFAGYMLDSKGDMLLMTENKGIMRFDGKNKVSTSIFLDKKKGEININAFYMYKDKKGQILVGGNGLGIGIIPHEDSIQRNRPTPVRYIREDKGITTGNVLTITEDNYGRYWFGRPTKGIGVYDAAQDKGVTFSRKDQTLDYGAMSSITDSYGNIWFGTDKGLCHFTPPATMPDSNFAFRKNMRLIAADYIGSSQVSYLKIWNNKYLVIGNDLGMSLLDLEIFYRSGGKKTIVRILQKYGSSIKSAGQNAVSIDSKNRIWATGDNGVICFDPKSFVADTVLPQVRLDSIVIGPKMYSLATSKSYWFKSEHNNMNIYFACPTDGLLYENIDYRYRLSGSDTWIKLDKQQINLTNLNSGSYCVEIQAIKDGMISETAKVEFRILPWFLDSKWFPVYFTILFGFGFWFYNQKQQKILAQQKEEQQKQAFLLQQKEQAFLLEQKEQAFLMKEKEKDFLLQQKEAELEENKREQNKLQVQAIVNQLNPHFINNILQLVQGQVENEEAQDVIQKLAENIGMVFVNSKDKKCYHTLANEMKLVRNYLFMQKYRFEKRLTYTLPDENQLDKFLAIPIALMLFQIHCENAVEHGINKQKKGGHLYVSLEEIDENYIKVIIEDNGIGRKKAAEIGSRGTQQGTKMLKKLEEIFNKQNEFALQTWYEDDIFTHENGEKYGTRVHLQIPKKYNFEI